ncbi:hypothetical protein [Dyadobacter sediminis]|uniref:Uncharacterized protein n=1 Tax=Dyadobacter sediminis TaxID=1493691 RepID=A0A5R9KBP7_9BACT|nr:hypothetical protein [Dyadobacter sediminis]TLU92137.1 hypothetical protein FEM55_15430 [Dyadobacter sediminis]GGB97112.1 hypothetical protein GCM10011325_25560 [Dyadobacter sediminis]
MKSLTKKILLPVLSLACSGPLLAQYTFFTPKDAFAIEISLPNSAEKRLPMYRNAITSLYVDGDRVLGGTTAKEGLSPYLFIASISKRTLATTKDLQEAVPGQKSIATGFCKGTGNQLYAGTLAHLKNNQQTGHLLQIRIGNGDAIEVKDLGTPVPGEGIFTLLSNSQGTELYGISYPGGRFFTYNIASGKVQLFDEISPKAEELKNLHDFASEPGGYLCKALVQDSQGLVYGSAPGNRMFAFDPAKKRFEFLKTPLPSVWGREVLGQVEAWAKAPDGKLYGGNAGDGQLFVLDPATKKIKNLGKPVMMNRLRALAFGRDGKLYGLAGGAPGYSHLFYYDEKGAGFVDLGNPEFKMVEPGIEQGILWRGFQLSTLTASADGKYMVMGEDEALSQLMIFPVAE